MDLDENLREITNNIFIVGVAIGKLQYKTSKEEYDANAEIAKIKQAFEDAGYFKTSHAQVTLPDCMTGSEFYERFVQEVSKLNAIAGEPPLNSWTMEKLVEAAKRASGIDKEGAEG